MHKTNKLKEEKNLRKNQLRKITVFSRNWILIMFIINFILVLATCILGTTTYNEFLINEAVGLDYLFN